MYTLPQFNLTVNIWRAGVVPPTGPPASSPKGNLAWGRRVAVPSTGGTSSIGIPLMTMTLLLPPHTDVRGDPFGINADVIECPAGTGRYYICRFVDDLGKGFANEHRGAVLTQVLPWPTPIP